jgi:hypothetical protein
MHGIPYLFGYLPIMLRMYTTNGGNVKKKANIKEQKAKLRDRFAGLFEQILRLRCASLRVTGSGFLIPFDCAPWAQAHDRQGRNDNVKGGMALR